MSTTAQPAGTEPASVPLYDVPHAVMRRPTGSTRRENLESLAIFVVLAIVYAIVGWRVVSVSHVVSFEALDRLARAYMVWWNDPAKLAAIGFSSPPLSALAYLPLTVLKPLATSLTAIPLLTATFGAATVALLGRTLTRCGFGPGLRWPMLLLFAANPLWLFYATNGTGDMVFLFLLAWGLLAFVAWHEGGEVIYLAGTAFAFGIGAMAKYDLIVVALLVAVAVAAATQRRRPEPGELEATIVGYVTPVVYAIALWTLLNGLILGRPFQWLESAPDTAAANAPAVSGPSAALGDVAARVLELGGGVAPLSALVVVLGAAAFVMARDDLALALVAILVLCLALVGAEALVHGDLARVTLRDGLPIALVALVAAAAICRRPGPLKAIGAIGTVVLLAVAVPLSWAMMERYPYQDQEQAFTKALRTGDDLTGQTSKGGYVVGIANERATAAFVKRVIGHQRHAILTDNARTYGVILLSGRPAVFRDRVQDGDGPWLRELSDPWGKVAYLLIDTRSADDLVQRRWPGAASGQDGFVPVFHTARYTIVSVPETRPAATP